MDPSGWRHTADGWCEKLYWFARIFSVPHLTATHTIITVKNNMPIIIPLPCVVTSHKYLGLGCECILDFNTFSAFQFFFFSSLLLLVRSFVWLLCAFLLLLASASTPFCIIYITSFHCVLVFQEIFYILFFSSYLRIVSPPLSGLICIGGCKLIDRI